MMRSGLLSVISFILVVIISTHHAAAQDNDYDSNITTSTVAPVITAAPPPAAPASGPLPPAVDLCAIHDPTTATATTKPFRIVSSTADKTKDCLAFIHYEPNQNHTGWDILDVTTTRKSDNVQLTYRAAGLLEGYSTWESILASNYSTQGFVNRSGPMGKFIAAQIAFMQDVASGTKKNVTTAGGEIVAILPQVTTAAARFMPYLEGLVMGINAAIDENKSAAERWDMFAIFAYQLQAELSDIAIAAHHIYGSKDPKQQELDRRRDEDFLFSPRRPRRDSSSKIPLAHEPNHCSALLKRTDTDLFLSHTTWSGYTGMLRVVKTYDFRADGAFNTSVTFTTQHGWIPSIDDWYTTTNQQVIFETTFSNFNSSLTKEYLTPETSPYFMRVVTANFLCGGDGKLWTDIFAIAPGSLNGAQYCNSWFVVAMDLFDPSGPLKANTFWYLEQLAGPYSQAADFSDLVNKKPGTFFASYNQPYFPEVVQRSGTADIIQQDGPANSYAGAPRGKIFNRNQSDITDMDSFLAVMRLNRWTTDPLSTIPNCTHCNPSRNPNVAIANRADLVPSDANFTGLGGLNYFALFAFGAIDTKATSYSLMKDKQEVLVQSGPSTSPSRPLSAPNDGFLPVFEWATLNPKLMSTRHRMQPARFAFPFLRIKLGGSTTDSSDEGPSRLAIGLGIAGGIVFAVLVAGGIFFYNKKNKKSGADQNTALLGGAESQPSNYGGAGYATV